MTINSIAPIRAQSHGYKLRQSADPNAIHLEVFIDLLCSDCAKTFQTIKQLYKSQFHFTLTLHIFSLSYFTYSFILNAALRSLIHAKVNHQDNLAIANYVMTICSLFFTYQSEFSNQATFQMSTGEVQTKLFELLDRNGLCRTTENSEFYELLKSSQIQQQSRSSWKFAVSRQVCSTPAFFVNGVQIFIDENGSDGHDWSAEKWIQYFESLT